ncbi:MAG: hypothetical protein H6726_00135 [Sandaracinaceae bacterium]|nr:hypothetical protein [Myxococcales bacterium]MCB9656025.1 hypothetical protein [Sandaracinaceae bacterium]
MHFLTEIDPRAAVAGSRDPLGLQPIWSALGREVVGNLTTVTTSVRGFTTLILGLYFADELVAAGGVPEAERVSAFLRFEQLAAYSRAQGSNGEEAGRILGITRVRRALHPGKGVPIGVGGDEQIMSNQKVYGLWGLYSRAGMSSGLLDPTTRGVTQACREHIEGRLLPALRAEHSPALAEIRRYVVKGGTFRPRDGLGRALGVVLGPTLQRFERTFYARHLVLGAGGDDPTRGRQERLWGRIDALNAAGRCDWGAPFSAHELDRLRDVCAQQGDDALLRPLTHIAVMEPLLVLAARIFGFVLVHVDGRVADVAEAVARTLGDRLSVVDHEGVLGMRTEIARASSGSAADLLAQMALDLAQGDYVGFVERTLRLNALVMAARGGAAWVEIRKGRLHVRLRSERVALPSVSQLPHLWENTYFLNSLKALGAEVMGRR